MVSLKELKEKVNGPGPEEHWRERAARYLSIRLTWILLNLFPKITPNQITIVMILFGFASAALFMLGGYLYVLIGVFVYHLYLIVDACDGEVARYKRLFSKRGLYLDYLGHVLVNPLIIMSLAIGVFRHNPGLSTGIFKYNPFPNFPAWIFLLLGFIAFYFMVMNSMLKLKKYEMRIDKEEFDILKEKNIKHRESYNKKKRLVEEVFFFFRIMTFNSILVFGVLNMMNYLVILYALIFPLEMLKRFYSEMKECEN